jgi:alpha-glucosidase
MYQGEPEIEFFEHVPTVWDETRVLNGRIADFVTVARRSGEEWYLGTLTDMQARELTVPLAFLEPDRRYVAHVYSDGAPDDPSRTKVRIARHLVDRATILRVPLAPSGGQAVRIVPATPGDVDRLRPYDDGRAAGG